MANLVTISIAHHHDEQKEHSNAIPLCSAAVHEENICACHPCIGDMLIFYHSSFIRCPPRNKRKTPDCRTQQVAHNWGGVNEEKDLFLSLEIEPKLLLVRNHMPSVNDNS
jgi:hypothetical protein